VIRGTGSYYPERILSNQDLEKMVDTTDEWIVTRTGIRERRIASPEQASSDLGTEAARHALDMAGWEATDVDTLIVATVTPDYPFPSCSCTIQGKLGASNAVAFDIGAACTGFIYGLNLSLALIRSGQARRILLVAVETLSRIVDYTDRSTCVLFGDGAGAVAIEKGTGDELGIRSVALGADGDQGHLLYMPAGGSRHPATHETVEGRMHTMKMNGNEVFKIAVRGMETITRRAIDMAHCQVEDIDLLLPHQANLRMIDATAKRLGIPSDHVVRTIQSFGNTSASSIPIAMDGVVRSGRVKRGDTLGMVAFGSGLTWGAAVIQWEGPR